MVVLAGTKLINQTVRILDLFNKYPALKNKSVRISIMVYQLGEFNKFYSIYAKAYSKLSDAYKAESRLCMSNLLIQIELFCISNGWDVNVLRDEGYTHLVDKIKEVESKGGKII